jgi:hypothetical protein
MRAAPNRPSQLFEEEFRNNYWAVTNLSLDYPRPVPATLHGLGSILGGFAVMGLGAWTAEAGGVNDAPTMLQAACGGFCLSLAADAYLLPAYRTTWANRLLINPFVVAPLVRGFTYLKRAVTGRRPGVPPLGLVKPVSSSRLQPPALSSAWRRSQAPALQALRPAGWPRRQPDIGRTVPPTPGKGAA